MYQSNFKSFLVHRFFSGARRPIAFADAAQRRCLGTRTPTWSGTQGLQSRQAIPASTTLQQQEQFLGQTS